MRWAQLICVQAYIVFPKVFWSLEPEHFATTFLAPVYDAETNPDPPPLSAISLAHLSAVKPMPILMFYCLDSLVSKLSNREEALDFFMGKIKDMPGFKPKAPECQPVDIVSYC